ncbi:MAG: GGDEF domain-containing protein [Actinomycetota bacterium]
MPTAETVTLPSHFIDELAAASSREHVLSVAAQWMPEIVPAERSSIALPSEEPGFLQIYALSESLIIPQGTRLPMKTSLVGQAFTSQQIVNCEDLSSSLASEAPTLVEFGMQSAIISPMVSAGRSIGTINLANSEVAFFTPEHQRQLRTIVDLLASFMAAHDRAASERERATTDHLTTCLSRRAILDHLQHACDSTEATPSILYLDVDGFKSVNDTHGHAWGDELLRVLTNRIRDVVRVHDHVGRLGGDEFLIVVDDDPTGELAEDMADEIIEVCSAPVTYRSIRVIPRVSIGVASVAGTSTGAEDLLHDADQAMYRAKGSPVHIAIADDEIRSHAEMIATIDRDLDHGMRSGEITYHYQPIRDLTTREIMGSEALVRWNHPRLGPIPAGLIVERIGSTGRTEAFSQWSLQTIVGHLRDLRAAVPWFDTKAVSINLSPRQLAWEGYADFHLSVLRDNGLRTHDVIIEVIESTEIRVADAAARTLRRLSDADVIIALDEFGTGHDALWYFTQFTIHAIKFDRNLVGVAAHDRSARTILEALAGMAHELGLVSVGEGIETDAEARVCQQLGIAHGQGWHFGRPMPVSQMIETMHDEGQLPARFPRASAREASHHTHEFDSVVR